MCGDVRRGGWVASIARASEELWEWDSRCSVLDGNSFHPRPWRFGSKSQVRR